MRLPSNKPPNQKPVQFQFRGHSSYQNNYDSTYHQTETQGDLLKNRTQEQKQRTKELGQHHRKGQFSSGSAIPFIGTSHYNASHLGAKPSRGSGGAKPLDSLLISPTIKMIAKNSLAKDHYKAYDAKFCLYQMLKE